MQIIPYLCVTWERKTYTLVRLQGSELSAVLPFTIFARCCLLRESTYARPLIQYRLLLIEFTEELFHKILWRFKNRLSETPAIFHSNNTNDLHRSTKNCNNSRSSQQDALLLTVNHN